mmetsp:Transcript_3561/g.7869  ORF Transcript_3561/g.7869 Transcript_3561/m.7869 type:complete len:222 (+) Transcript_3561:126-791(+)
MSTNAESTSKGESGGKNVAVSELNPPKARRLLIGLISGDLLLYLLFRVEIPRRDYVACRIGLVLIVLLTSFESPGDTKILTSKSFMNKFKILSTFDVVFTILIPWMMILEGILNKTETKRNGHLLAAHLFIFQAQIAGECLINLAGERRKWLKFPFTCAANAYRGVTIGTWIMRVSEEDELVSRDVIVPVIVTAIWIYTSFVFIPRVWYPLLKEQSGSLKL